MTFSHPLARDAKVWPSVCMSGPAPRLLVIVTTLELSPEAKRYKVDKVDRLRDAAQEWLAANPDAADGYMLVNRTRTWGERA